MRYTIYVLTTSKEYKSSIYIQYLKCLSLPCTSLARTAFLLSQYVEFASIPTSTNTDLYNIFIFGENTLNVAQWYSKLPLCPSVAAQLTFVVSKDGFLIPHCEQTSDWHVSFLLFLLQLLLLSCCWWDIQPPFKHFISLPNAYKM